MNQLTISAENLSKRFHHEWIFRHFNYTFQSGKTYAITGPNGSGKSTIMQVLWGQMPASSGNLVYRLGEEKVETEKIFQQVSIAAPYQDLIDEFTLEEQVNFHFKMKKSLDGRNAETIIRAMYLEHARDKFIGNFSSGMRQRLKLGLAFYTDSSVLFLDEPGTNLDQQAFEWYKEQLGLLPKDRVILIASNRVEEYPENAEKVNILDYKAIRQADGHPQP